MCDFPVMYVRGGGGEEDVQEIVSSEFTFEVQQLICTSCGGALVCVEFHMIVDSYAPSCAVSVGVVSDEKENIFSVCSIARNSVCW